MFGRTNDQGSSALPAQGAPLEGGRSAAISILPGMALPHDLVQSAPPAPAAATPFGGEQERELVSVGAPSVAANASASAAAPAAPASFAPPAPAAPAAKAKRSSFSGLRK